MATKPTRNFPEPRYANITRRKVHQLLKDIEEEIRRDFATAALAGALDFLKEISEAQEVPVQKRIELLTKIYEAANKAIEKLADAPFENIPLWADRDRSKKILPTDFVKLHYPSYGTGLSIDQIKDPKLRHALWNQKSKQGGWPENFVLASKSEAIDRLIAELGPENLTREGAANAPPHIRRLRDRAVKAQQLRLKK
jgi:hypothetical protein